MDQQLGFNFAAMPSADSHRPTAAHRSRTLSAARAGNSLPDQQALNFVPGVPAPLHQGSLHESASRQQSGEVMTRAEKLTLVSVAIGTLRKNAEWCREFANSLYGQASACPEAAQSNRYLRRGGEFFAHGRFYDLVANTYTTLPLGTRVWSVVAAEVIAQAVRDIKDGEPGHDLYEEALGWLTSESTEDRSFLDFAGWAEIDPTTFRRAVLKELRLDALANAYI
ncbi:hypothetical protein PQR68_34505 [Paraburkholderia agricolaris]|uniref:hypothetical protein n=1 Tax=Paraburkholderia agricolaris TaxID=2152888 RepID=UPI0038B82B7D